MRVILDVDLRAFGGSSLVGDTARFQDRALDLIPNHRILIPNSNIPSNTSPRNTVFLALALRGRESSADRIVIRTRSTGGIPTAGGPIAAFEHLASRRPAGSNGAPRIWKPLQRLTGRASSVWSQLGLDYGLTHSCYDPDPDGRPCGRCDSCLLRARGFAEAGAQDPLLYPAR